jgi:5-methylcytosine-specific restriction endonuclease McrA
MIMGMIETQGFRCALSGRQLTPETASLDHIVPLSRGGTHDRSNLWVVDQHVNTAKGTLTVDEFVAMCRDVARRQAERN